MLNEILNIYDCWLRDGKKGLTQTEAIHRIVEKINLIIQHFNVLENNCNKSIEVLSEKVEYYLNNGMVNEVDKKLDQFTQDGTFDKLINEKLFNEIKSIKNDYSTVQIVTPNDGGIVKKFIMEDNKMAKIRRKHIQCELTAKQWQQAWENLGANTNNNNGSIWVPFYWGVNPNKVVDSTMTLRDLNKWVWQSLGQCKIGVYGLGYINENGCYVYVENKNPSEQTIGLAFTICITELYD